MSRTLPVLILVFCAAPGCDSPRPAPATEAGPATAATAVDQEVLIATIPEGADVLLAGARVGGTPFRMLVRTPTNVVLEKEGYVRQAILVTPDGEPNMVVELVADESGETEEGKEEDGDEDADRAAGRKPAKGKEQVAAAAQEVGEDEQPGTGTGGQVEAEQVETAAPKGKGKTYDNMADLKRDHRAGRISAADYRHWQSVIRARRAEELERLRQEYAEGKLTKAEYRNKTNAVKNKYEGR